MHVLTEGLLQWKQAMKVGDVARILNVSQDVFYQMVQRVTIPVFRLGTTLRIDPATCLGWLESRGTLGVCLVERIVPSAPDTLAAERVAIQLALKATDRLQSEQKKS